MSASQIPNLNTLRRGGLRSRGRSAPESSHDGTANLSRTDDVVRCTDHDAATSRLSAVDAGYLKDDFARLMTHGAVERRLPLMNRGTYVRTTAIDRVVDVFLESKPAGRKQIISLGAGTDTRFFRIKQRRPEVDLVYHELDFGQNTAAKIQALQSPAFVQAAKSLCQVDLQHPTVHVSNDGSRLSSADYYVHPQDLRALSVSHSPLPGVDAMLPTLLISECCLIYLSPSDADAVLAYFTTIFPTSTPLSIVLYEPIRPHDAFGRTMIRNLTARGIHLQTWETYADLQQQMDRLTRFGFKSTSSRRNGDDGGVAAVDVELIWSAWIDEAEKERVEGLEWMDEVEEFSLLARHYCVAWGWRGFAGGSPWLQLIAHR